MIKIIKTTNKYERKYEIVNQEDINYIGDNNKCGNVIDDNILNKENIINNNNVTGILFENINNMKHLLQINNKNNIRIMNCNLVEGENIFVHNTISFIYIKDSTLNSLNFERCLIYKAEINSSYIDRLYIGYSTSEIIEINNSVINELVINSSVIKKGLLITYNSTINKLIISESLVNNTGAIIYNTLLCIEKDNKEYNIESDIYEEDLEDVAKNLFKICNSCIIYNNDEDVESMRHELREVLNDSLYTKNNYMICGIYENNKDNKTKNNNEGDDKSDNNKYL